MEPPPQFVQISAVEAMRVARFSSPKGLLWPRRSLRRSKRLACVVVGVNKDLFKDVREYERSIIKELGRVVRFDKNGVVTTKDAVRDVRCAACGLGLGLWSQLWWRHVVTFPR
eukprot:6213303-Pleurochrysis_carterae.AAC.3